MWPEDELGHEEDILSVEGPGTGGDQYCGSVQLPGSTRTFSQLPAARERTKLFRVLGAKKSRGPAPRNLVCRALLISKVSFPSSMPDSPSENLGGGAHLRRDQKIEG